MSLANTLLSSVLLSDNTIDRYENSPSTYGVLQFFQDQTEDPTGIITEKMKLDALASMGRAVNVPVLNTNSAVVVTNTRPIVIPAANSTSALMPVTFQTLSFGFQLSPATYSNNAISMEKDYAAKFLKGVDAIHRAMSTTADTALNLNKNTTFDNDYIWTVSGAGDLVGTVNTSVLPQNFNYPGFIYGDAAAIMHDNGFMGRTSLIGNGGFKTLVDRSLQTLGPSNLINNRYSFQDKPTYFSPTITPVGTYATSYMVHEGTVGLLYRHEPDALAGTKTTNGYEFGTTILPGGIPASTFYYEGVLDTSAYNGVASAEFTRSAVMHFGFTVEVAFVTAYASNPSSKRPIIKIVINNS